MASPAINDYVRDILERLGNGEINVSGVELIQYDDEMVLTMRIKG